MITDQELAEVRDRFDACLTSHGFSNIKHSEDGGYEFTMSEGTAQDVMEQQTSECSEEAGENAIGALYSFIRRNPQNLDEATIMAACLVRKAVVDPAYSAKDYAQDAPDQSFPYLPGVDGEAAFNDCNSDPSGLYG
jgi:hypothetical protein